MEGRKEEEVTDLARGGSGKGKERHSYLRTQGRRGKREVGKSKPFLSLSKREHE